MHPEDHPAPAPRPDETPMHLAVLTSAGITIASEAMSVYAAHALHAQLEQQLRTAGRSPILRIPVDSGTWPINVQQLITWALVPKGGTTPWSGA